MLFLAVLGVLHKHIMSAVVDEDSINKRFTAENPSPSIIRLGEDFVTRARDYLAAVEARADEPFAHALGDSVRLALAFKKKKYPMLKLAVDQERMFPDLD
jgi:hypothetical protein